MLLLERWQSIVRDRPHQVALSHLPSRRRWTFAELDATARSLPPLDPHQLHGPSGHGPDFVLQVLRAWYQDCPLCPLEEGQPLPAFPVPTPPARHLKTTSATSQGTARGVAFAPGQLLADVDNLFHGMGLSIEYPNLATVSLSHSYGFSSLVLPLLCHGIPLLLTGSSLPDEIRQALLALDRPVTLPSVPALWRAWLEAGILHLPSIHLAISAGAPLPLELEHRIHAQTGLKVHNFYGASECGGIAYDASETPRSDPTYIGTLLPGVSASLQEPGCLEVHGPAVGQGYWPEPLPSLRDGSFLTSDLARLAGNQVYLLGRADDIIQVAGRKVTPESIERVLAGHPDVRQCLVFGIPSPDATRQQSVVACLTVHGPTTPDRFRVHLGQKLPSWQVPRDWWFVDSLQTNARGKISRAWWRAQYLDRFGEAPSDPA